jgi:hypothetical protein
VSTRALFAIALFSAGICAASGCQAIAGIKDRYYDADGGSASRAECEKYCSDVMANCKDQFAVYASNEICLAVCARLPAGDASGKGNTVACRARNARLAGATGEYGVHCPLAGPGGGSECGPDCDSYCLLFGKVCPDDTLEGCSAECPALSDDGTFDVARDEEGDTLACRLVHTSSATLDPATHCWHARLAPTKQGDTLSPCASPPDQPPSCKDYCRIAMVACSADLAVYDSEAECESVCGALDPGTNGDESEDTVGCRKYHAYNATGDASLHCPHAGPGGDGHCGTGNCAPYCRIAEAACPTQFAAKFADRTACETACAALPGAAGDSGYAVATAAGNAASVQCRLLYATRAFADVSACESALGGGSCQ